MRYFIVLSYNGKHYHGWQIQPNVNTVQETLQTALSVLLKQQIEIVGAGRTDAGVHASYMVAHFDSSIEFDTNNMVYRLNGYLPTDIAVFNILPVKPDAHARFDALKRQYTYKVATFKNVFNTEQAYYFKPTLNVEAMNAASAILLKYSDFECFSKTHTDVKTFICDIEFANWEQQGTELHFTIKADRFLRNMVRAIVGTLINVGTQKIDVNDLHTIIKSKDRGQAGYSVPAHGLYLNNITYPEDIYLT